MVKEYCSREDREALGHYLYLLRAFLCAQTETGAEEFKDAVKNDHTFICMAGRGTFHPVGLPAGEVLHTRQGGLDRAAEYLFAGNRDAVRKEIPDFSSSGLG